MTFIASSHGLCLLKLSEVASQSSMSQESAPEKNGDCVGGPQGQAEERKVVGRLWPQPEGKTRQQDFCGMATAYRSHLERRSRSTSRRKYKIVRDDGSGSTSIRCKESSAGGGKWQGGAY